MKEQTALTTPLEVASYSYRKGHSQAIAWVRHLAKTFFDDDPDVIEVLEFVADQLQEDQGVTHDHFMMTLAPKILDVKPVRI